MSHASSICFHARNAGSTSFQASTRASSLATCQQPTRVASPRCACVLEACYTSHTTIRGNMHLCFHDYVKVSKLTASGAGLIIRFSFWWTQRLSPLLLPDNQNRALCLAISSVFLKIKHRVWIYCSLVRACPSPRACMFACL